MVNQTVKSVVERFEQKGILSRPDYTFVEYVEELMKFQTEAARLVFNQEDVGGIHIDEVIARFEAMAREKNLKNNQEVFEGITALKTINKEIAVALAGKSGEDRVAKTLQYVERPDATFFRNVYICDEVDETEMDAVVLTKNGLIVLEVKNAKGDVTIAPDGRILFNNASCYHDISVGEKMIKKRRLLKKRVQKELSLIGINKEVVVKSLLVFSNPYKVHIQVNDQFKQEDYCRRDGLNNRIETFESNIVFSDSELESLNKILSTIETEQKRFTLGFDTERIKESFAKAYDILFEEPEKEKNIDFSFNDFEENKIIREEVFQKARDSRRYQKALTITAAVAMGLGLAALPGMGIPSVGITSGVLLKVLK
ncbi:nuclease-related domain-containing protein [Faecalicatena contorta]|uniref:nuclease-related domain-containing protein n=1 Tax=Faecalicatena contorta TaxID=39482 RepID=UPI001F29FC9A|nr:nuclease-related domain-containing protein [Faecalicatena contorta]MCF2554394.1 NERD domain-containing protein [Faecalicatena contorta]